MDDTGPDGWLEVTAAAALGYPATKVFQYTDNTELVPTTSVLFMAEYAALSWLRFAASYDLIATTEREVIDGKAVDTVLPSRIALGTTIAPLHIDFRNARLEGQGSGFLALTLEASPKVVPVIMGRLHVMPNRHHGVGIYLGTSYHFVIQKLTLLYGVGYRF
jgi:hypothetical protein